MRRRILPQRTGSRTKCLTMNMGTVVKKAMRGVRMKPLIKRKVKSNGRMKTPMKRTVETEDKTMKSIA